MYLLAGILGGIFITLSSNLNATLVQREGLLRGSFYNYFFACAVSGSIILITGVGFPNVIHLDYRLLGGVIGVSVLMMTSFIIPKLPMMYATVLIFVGQLAAGFIIDIFQGRDVTSFKVIGAVLILLGMLYNIGLDKASAKAENNLAGSQV